MWYQNNKIFALHCLVLSQSTRVTDGQNYDFQDRASIAASCGKTEYSCQHGSLFVSQSVCLFASHLRCFVFMPTSPKTFDAGGILFSDVPVRESVSESVSLCIPKTLWTPYLKNQLREFQPILATAVFGFRDATVRFWSQKFKGQSHSRQ